MSSSRDDFPQRVIRILERRTGATCSNPDCGQPTSGPGTEPDTVINIGVGAHITAAAPEGPRYDKSLMVEQRRSIENGIWLCQTCSKLIDSDVPRYPSETLRQWKKRAEDGAFASIATRAGARFGLVQALLELDDTDRERLRSLGLSPEESVEAVTARLKSAVTEDLAAFRAANSWPRHVIGRDIALVTLEKSQPLTLAGLAAAIGSVERVTLISDPGTGKTTFLVGLAESILAQENLVPALVPLNEWSDRKEDLFSFLGHRNALGGFRPQHWMQMAFHGRLILLLDGWNELDSASQLLLSRELQALRRDFPLLGILLTTRRQHLSGEGPVLEIQPLTRSQQRDLAGALRGGAGETLLEQAWRTPGIRELVEIPLYLTALLESSAEGRLPETREELLRAFVAQLEREEDRRLILDQVLQGQHQSFLITLASEANQLANTAIPDEVARRAVAARERELVEAGQFAQGPEPKFVLETLVNSHALVRPPEGAGSSVAFQHQQIQEWYASFEVDRLMRRSADGDAAARAQLKCGALDRLSWAESVLFACERVSRASQRGAEVVAHTIRLTLSIDPMFAAEMIRRSAEGVWSQIAAEVLAFVDRWHRPGTPDRATRFMIMTGRGEFSERVWALVGHSSDQTAMHALQLAPRFYVSVLGPRAEERLAALPMPGRRRVLGAIAHEGGYEAMELATRLAQVDADPEVTAEVLEALDFRGAERLVVEVLRVASEAVWARIVRKGLLDKLSDPELDARVRRDREAYLASLEDPVQVVYRLAETTPKSAACAERLQALLKSPTFNARDDRGRTAIEAAFKAYPAETALALRDRLEQGLELPYRAEEMLEAAPAVEAGPLVERALEVRTNAYPVRPEFAVLGPTAVGQMIDRSFALDEEYARANFQWTQVQSNEVLHLRHAIPATRLSSFTSALLARSAVEDPRKIGRLADLLALHGRSDEGDRLELPPAIHEALVQRVLRWIEILLTSSDATRHEMADATRAAGRLGDARLVSGIREMLRRDLTEWARAQADRTRHGSRDPKDSTVGYVVQYQRALVSIGGPEATAVLYEFLPDLRFGVCAAGALVETVHPRARGRDGARSFFGRDFSGIKDRRSRRASGEEPEASEAAERIFAVVRELLGTHEGAREQHAIQLAARGLALPHRPDQALMDGLLALARAPRVERLLLTALALAGEVIPASRLIGGVRELLAATDHRRWELLRDPWELFEWLELLPFSDRPAALLEMWESVPSELRQPYRWQGVLRAVGFSPDAEAGLAVLVGLAQRHAPLLGQHEWLQALAVLNGESGARGLLETVVNALPDAGAPRPERIESYHLGQQLAGNARRYPLVRAQMLLEYGRLPPGLAKSVLEEALGQAATPDALMALIQGYGREGRAFDQRLARAAERLALGRRPSDELTGAYELFGVPLGELRRALFRMTGMEGSESALALGCLLGIEHVRDEHGRLDAEPRHPDVESGRPWPRESQ